MTKGILIVEDCEEAKSIIYNSPECPMLCRKWLSIRMITPVSEEITNAAE